MLKFGIVFLIKPGFTNYQPHPSTLGPEVEQKQAWKGEGTREGKEIKISLNVWKILNFFDFLRFRDFDGTQGGSGPRSQGYSQEQNKFEILKILKTLKNSKSLVKS